MVAIIPARGGSKGLPGKNSKELNGKPMIAYTIEAAKGSSCIKDVYVSTDSQEIADIAIKYGACVPFLRPKELSTDNSLAIDVYIHAINKINEIKGEQHEKFMVLLPTSPLRTSQDIDNAYRVFIEKKPDTLIAVKESPVPPGWFFTVNRLGMLDSCNFGKTQLITNRQDSDKYYIPCGAIYILDSKLLASKRTYYSNNSIPYIMDEIHSIDIDSINDFHYAEFLMKKIQNG